jgi:hypothetical protein
MSALAEQHPEPRQDELTARLTKHAVASIEAADHFSLPFPHIFFRNFFPADFYAEMVGKWPTSGYDPIKGDGTRMALRLYGDNVEKIDPALRDAWRAVSGMLCSAEVEQAIRAKLNDGLAIRARGDKVPGPDALRLVAKPVLYSDKDGYQIKPHPDARKKVVTMQLYCPPDNSQEALGTTLYRASLKGLAHAESYFLEPVKTLPFLPNVGYAFVVLKAYHSLLKMSWHGRPKITVPIERPRVSILNTFYIDENVGF